MVGMGTETLCQYRNITKISDTYRTEAQRRFGA